MFYLLIYALDVYTYISRGIACRSHRGPERKGVLIMNTVKLYQVTTTNAHQVSDQGVSYSLYPWSGDNRDYSGSDDGGKDYILPDGFEVLDSTTGERQIHDAKGESCGITNKSNRPCLLTSDGDIMLKIA